MIAIMSIMIHYSINFLYVGSLLSSNKPPSNNSSSRHTQYIREYLMSPVITKDGVYHSPVTIRAIAIHAGSDANAKPDVCDGGDG